MSTTNGDQMIYEKQQKPHGHQNKSSNNKGKLNKHKKNKSNLKWKVKRSAIYITRLCEESNKDINDPWWKIQLGRTLSNCNYVIRTNGTFSKKRMNNFTILYIQQNVMEFVQIYNNILKFIHRVIFQI